MHSLLFLSAALLASSSPAAAEPKCHPSSIPIPSHFGLDITSLTAEPVTNFTAFHPMTPFFHVPFDPTKPLDFCNVTLTYTHPATSDSTIVTVWLPPSSAWKSRFLGQGGGGLSGCFEGSLAAGVSAGFASANTDTGHDRFDPTAERWTLVSKGNVDLRALDNFAGRALPEMTGLAKQVVEGFYGKKPEYAYFSGCSAGGRQGLVLAQRYPREYDGILANAPALGWSEGAVSMLWGQVVMAREGVVPPPCEMVAIHQAAVEACDGLDGVEDGIISAPGLCDFDALSAIGRPACGGKRKVSKQAANIAKKTYKGFQLLWPYSAVGYAMPLASEDPRTQNIGGMLQTTCEEDGQNCKQLPFNMITDWVRFFVARDPDFDVMKASDEEFATLLRTSVQQYQRAMDPDWADLSEFKQAGGKMITWHGLSDQLLTANKTAEYYTSVLAADPSAADYYRYFEAPGVYHCFGGNGFYPTDVWDALVDWVEHGRAPEKLTGRNVAEGDVRKKGATRPLCLFPKVARFVGPDVMEEGSFVCAEDFGGRKGVMRREGEKDEL